MILYIDASALVKRYVLEAGTTDVEALLGTAELAGAALPHTWLRLCCSVYPIC